MEKIIRFSLVMVALACSTNAFSRDSKAMYSIQEALKSAAAKELLDPAVKLYFGTQKHTSVIKKFGEARTNKKSNGFNKTDKEGCEWVFVSAMRQLQTRALADGANAVINIKSNYKNKVTVSNTQYMCGNGALLVGAAFKGDVVKLK